jgi:hypothetical protein
VKLTLTALKNIPALSTGRDILLILRMPRICRLLLPGLFLLFSCSDKKEAQPEKDFFPVLSFIKSQVAHIDTSLYSIMRIDYRDSVNIDTTFIHRDSFRALAVDFLSLPDLAEKKYRKRFTEESMFDETMNRVILSYRPVNPGKEEIQSQEVLINPNPALGDKVTSILIDRVVNNRNGYLEKNLLWQVDQYFQVTTTIQKPGQPETISIMKVTWNEQAEE